MASYEKLLQPLQVAGLRLKNRMLSAPTSMAELGPGEHYSDDNINYYKLKAAGGVALVSVGDVIVDLSTGRSHPMQVGLDDPTAVPYLVKMADAIHSGGAAAEIEIDHGGALCDPVFIGGKNAIGPSGYVDDWGDEVKEMTEEQIYEIADKFAEAAATAKACGFDMVMIHAGHGWLLHQFISEITNHRTDKWGGSLENRMRFPLLVVEKVRAAVGRAFPIDIRISGSERMPGGYDIQTGIEIAKALDGKVDLIHVSAGLDIEEAQAVHTHPTMFLPHGVNVHYAAAIKAAGVKTPVVTLGGINTPELAEEIIADGKADVVAMARQSIADPYFPEKARHGDNMDIIPCLRCLDCLTGLHNGNNLSCAVNPRTAQECRFDRMSAPAKRQRKVLVVGGGPGGMQAAVTAAQRGHQVTLAEATDKLGGLLKFTDYDDLKVDLMRLKNYLIHQVEKNAIELKLNTTVTPEFIKAGGYDAVILAVGSTPSRPPIPGLDDPSVEHATTVYTKLATFGKKVAVLGGGLVGCETGLYLAENGHDVTIIEMQSEIAPEANWMHKEGMMQSFAKAPITCRTGLRVARIEPGKGVYATNAEGSEEFIPADGIVYAMGMRPNTGIVDELKDACIDTIAVGDCVKPRKARQAMEEGYWAAVNLA